VQYNLLEIAKPAVQDFIFANENSDEGVLTLRSQTTEGLPSSLIAQQLVGRRKAREKLPSYYKSRGIIYPPRVNLEQSSSEVTAVVKTKILLAAVTNAETVIDLTGGFGVDSTEFAKAFRKVIYIEPDQTLATIAAHNHKVLIGDDQQIEHINNSAEVFLNNFQGKASAFFIDPSRRIEGRRVHGLGECTPNILELQNRIFESSPILLVKTSPLLDITKTIGDLKFVKAVFVLSVHNECKEVLYLSSPGWSQEPIISAMELSSPEDSFDFAQSDESKARVTYSYPLQFIYEPNAAILKSGGFKIISERFNLKKLDVNTHIYTSETLQESFPGRIFKVSGVMKSDPKDAKSFFPTRKANVMVRNYPSTPDQLKKKLKLMDGGDQYLLATTAEGKRLLIALTREK
jgi:hypothetical protein